MLELVVQRDFTSSCSKPDWTGPEQPELVGPAVCGFELDGEEKVTRCFQVKHLIGSQYISLG